MATYSAPMDALAFTTATDVFEITAASTARVLIHMIELEQTTDLGDAAEEVLRIGLYRGVTAGSTGTALTEQPYGDSNDGAATAAVVANRGTASTGGTLLQIIGWNIRIPTQWIWTPELRPVLELSTVGTFKLMAAPADSVTVSGTVIWEEL
jgi:hypothetical protein